MITKHKIFKLKLFSNQSEKTDKVFLFAVLLVTMYGTLMVISAGGPYAEARYGDGAYFVKKQTIWLLIGFTAMLFSSRIDPQYYKKYAPHFYSVTLILLILVLVVGFVGNGAQRWITVGPLTIQPSEIGKLSLIMILARYFSDKEELALDNKNSLNSFLYGTLYPCVILLIPIILVMLQKHLSCIIILAAIGISMIYISGVNPKYLCYFGAIGVAGITYLAIFTDYTKERIVVWQNPEAYKLTGGWQTLQGLMAIGSGGLFGGGYGESILKHCYVSEPANDMIFAILCEELGFFGAAIAIFLFCFLIVRGFKVALRSQDTFSRLLTAGICIKTAIQVLLNIAVVTNSIPNTGISLPFFSYGGSSLVMLFFEMGIIMSVSRQATIQK